LILILEKIKISSAAMTHRDTQIHWKNEYYG